MRTFSEELILLLVDRLVIGVLILVAAFFLNRILESIKAEHALRKEIDILRDQTRLKHLQQQIQELYSPLLGLIQYSNVVHRIALKKMRGTPDNGEVKRYFVEKYYLPLNAQVADLIRTKIYLIASDGIPDSFVRFLAYQAQYESLHTLWRDKGTSSDGITPEPWPADFERDVQQSLEKLRLENNEYVAYLQRNQKPA